MSRGGATERTEVIGRYDTEMLIERLIALRERDREARVFEARVVNGNDDEPEPEDDDQDFDF